MVDRPHFCPSADGLPADANPLLQMIATRRAPIRTEEFPGRGQEAREEARREGDGESESEAGRAPTPRSRPAPEPANSVDQIEIERAAPARDDLGGELGGL